MEIFIVGLILVALMVYASTKIKKVAAEAFERETIEAEDFTISKPKGFIHPFNETSAFAFEAYTKDFGAEPASDFKQSRATLRIISDSTFEAVCKDAKKSADKILSKNYVGNAPEGQKIFLMESEKAEKEVSFFTFWKIIESRQRKKIYEFRVSVLEDNREKFEDETSELIETFTVK
jgi:hypothetical protein